MSYVSRKDMNQSQASYVRYSDNRDYSKVVLFVATIVMVLVIALVTGIIKARAMGDKPLHYSVYGCVPYTHAMVTGHQASGLTHSQCNDEDTTRKGKENNTPVVKTKSPIVMPVDSVQDESPAVVPADTTNDKPAKDSKDSKSNNGHGNNEDGIDSSNPGDGPKNDPAVDPSSPVDDEKEKGKKSNAAGLALLGLSVTFKKGRKEYIIYGVRHVENNGKYLYLYMLDWAKSPERLYLVQNAKIVNAWIVDLDFSYTPDETREILL